MNMVLLLQMSRMYYMADCVVWNAILVFSAERCPNQKNMCFFLACGAWTDGEMGRWMEKKDTKYSDTGSSAAWMIPLILPPQPFLEHANSFPILPREKEYQSCFLPATHNNFQGIMRYSGICPTRKKCLYWLVVNPVINFSCTHES